MVRRMATPMANIPWCRNSVITESHGAGIPWFPIKREQESVAMPMRFAVRFTQQPEGGAVGRIQLWARGSGLQSYAVIESMGQTRPCCAFQLPHQQDTKGASGSKDLFCASCLWVKFWRKKKSLFQVEAGKTSHSCVCFAGRCQKWLHVPRTEAQQVAMSAALAISLHSQLPLASFHGGMGTRWLKGAVMSLTHGNQRAWGPQAPLGSTLCGFKWFIASKGLAHVALGMSRGVKPEMEFRRIAKATSDCEEKWSEPIVNLFCELGSSFCWSRLIILVS